MKCVPQFSFFYLNLSSLKLPFSQFTTTKNPLAFTKTVMSKDNVQRLLEAEADRNKKVADAKARKQATVKKAKADADEAVKKFRDERDKDLEEFKSAQLKAAGDDNAKSVQDTDKLINDMKSIASSRLDKVADLCVQLVCTVDCKK